MNRSETLGAALACVTKDRANTYGSAEDNFARIAAYWGIHLGVEINATDVAVMLSLVKVARLKTSPGHADNWVDLAGYAACGSEIASNAAAKETANGSST